MVDATHIWQQRVTSFASLTIGWTSKSLNFQKEVQEAIATAGKAELGREMEEFGPVLAWLLPLTVEILIIMLNKNEK